MGDGGKSHRYVMLSVGDETFFDAGRELTHRSIFPFLYESFRTNPRAAYVGFYLGYDFTMWLKSLPENRAWYLFTPAGAAKRRRRNNPVPFPVYCDGWEFDILGMKRFKLRPHVDEGQNKNQWLYVCDTGHFFQTSFLNVIEPTEKKWPTGAPCTREEFEIIKAGKEHRSDEVTEGDTSYVSDMARYNRLENEILCRSLSILNRGFVDTGIRLKRDSFYGPGAAIQQWLTQKEKQGRIVSRKQLEPILPEWVINAARASYYGGWFEIFYHGHIPGASYEYDITSAYPHAMRNLPCLCGTWSRGCGNSGVPVSTVIYVKACIAGRNPSVGAMPFRNPKGNILRPHTGTGWYLHNELLSAKSAGLIDDVEILDWIAYEGCSHEPPLAEMADLFQRRLKIGKATPTGKAIKLMLNSAYGKFAQSIGNPKFGNPVYASMITSACRTMILDAIATHPNGTDDVLMVATDGVYFRSPHPTLPLSEELGKWEADTKQNLTLMKPGVYWDDKAREAVRNGEVASIKSRGISAKSLSDNLLRIDAAFHSVRNDLSQPFPSLSIAVPFSVISPRLALARGKWGTAGHVSWNETRTDSASLAPKRTAPYIDARGHIRSHPMTVPPGTESTPYNKSFGYGMIENPESEMFTQDGTVDNALSSIVGWDRL